MRIIKPHPLRTSGKEELTQAVAEVHGGGCFAANQDEIAYMEALLK